MADLNKIVEEVKGLSVVELNDLVKMLEEEFGVSAAAMAVAAPAAAGAAAPAAEEKSEFNVCATAFDATKKIAAIKVVREITGLGLGEAKALVESIPGVIKENVPAEQAKAMADQLKEAGITVELK